MDIQDQKRIVRRTVLAKRAAIDEAGRTAAARAVTEAVLALPEIRTAPSVMAFASFGTEIPTDPLVESLLAAGRPVLMPLVDGARLRAAAVERLDDLAPGYRGIREPAVPVPVDPPAGTVVLVPGVAFDPSGGRLGYGGGFYDSFLSEAAAGDAPLGPLIGLCFDCQVVDRVPTGPGDVPVGLIVTERRVLRPQ